VNERRKRRSRTILLIDFLAVALALGGVTVIGVGRLVRREGPQVRVSGVVAEADPSPSPPRTVAMPTAIPVNLSIPAIGVDTPLTRLGVNPDGTLEVPMDFSVAGWFSRGPRPGEQGAAVIAGHVDSRAGPAVFFRLGELHPGSVVRVATRRGEEVLFRVYAVREYRKTAFPTSLVYGPTPRPELRLITCGGAFDHETGHYLDNIVVFARYVKTRAQGGA
jgi:sortase (surface protein transpeptidase)